MELLEDRCLLSTTVAEFPLQPGTTPFGIAAGPDGNVWFTESQAGQIGAINPTTHAITEYPITTAGSDPLGIIAGPDGNLWFTEAGANIIAAISPTSHTVVEYPIPTSGSQPTAITVGPDGNLWFTESAANKIGSINPTTHAFSEFAVPTANSSPTGIVAGPDGNLWFTENSANKIAAINAITHVFGEYATPSPNSQPYAITASPDGFLWFTEANTNRIAQINPTTHGILEFPIPTSRSGPAGITAGTDGNLWFVENKANHIGSINLTTHVVSETAIPTPASSPGGITTGPGGVLLFTESNGNQIGEVFSPPLVTATPVNATVVEGQTATFLAGDTVGLPVPTVIWQVSIDGGLTYTPLVNGPVFSSTTTTFVSVPTYSGVTTDTLTITDATTAMSGYKYEAVFSNGAGLPAITAPATLTVNSVLSITPAPPQGLPGVLYNQTLSVVGSTTQFTLFSVNNFNAGGTGLTFSDISTNPVNGTITITGTPTAPGNATFTVAIANSGGFTLTKILTITISPPLSIATASLPPATAGIAYTQDITVIGGAQPYTTFSVTNFNGGATGLIPAAITPISALGIFSISATPPAAGTATFTINVADSAGTTLTKNYTIVVNPPFAITPTLPQGTAGTNYHQTLTVTGGGVPYTTLAVANFIGGTTGLTLANLTTSAAAGTITITGTPSAAGTFSFTANVVDALGASLNKLYTVTINPALTVTPPLPQGTAGVNYHQTITVAGGSTPYTTFTVTGFNAGATGLTAAALTLNTGLGTIAVVGSPTAAGTIAFTVNVIDAAGSTLTKAFTIAINPAPTIGNLTTTQWTAGAPGFPGVLSVGGGTGSLFLAGYLGLPTGLIATLNGNTVGFLGTPSAAGTFAASVTIHDALGASVTRPFSITINAAPTVSGLSATQWTIGRPGFNGVLALTGGTGALSITNVAGLPAGLSLIQIGNTLGFTGTPTTVGTFAASVTIHDAIGASGTRTFSITINAAPTLGNLTATQWSAGKAGFNGVLSVAAGTAPFTFASSTGLPTGLTAVITGNTISFTGTPSVPGTFAAGSITVRDAAGATVTRTFSITINPPLTIVTASFPPSSLAMLYSAAVHSTGGTGAVAFALTAGSLPPGMRLSSTGVISGATRGFGSFTFTVTATDAVGATFSAQYTLTISRHA